MRANERIRDRRIELGLSDVEVARRSGLSIHEYCDAEWHDNELLAVVNLRNLKQLCLVLDLDPFDVLEFKCAFCTGSGYLPEYHLPRNEIVRRQRLVKGWSVKELGDKIGFYEEVIQHIEIDADYLDSWSANLVKDLAKHLDVPPQVLLGIKCGRCHR